MDAGQAELLPGAERAPSVANLVCGRCGNPYSPGRPDKRFCSNRCRAAASREKQATRVRKMEALIGELAGLAKSGPS